MKIGIKRPTKPLEIIETTQKYRGELMPLIIKGDSVFNRMEPIYLSEDKLLMMLADEAGHPKGLPHNFMLETTNPYFPIQEIVGSVLFIRIKQPNYSEELWDYEVDTLTEQDIKIIKSILKG